MTQDSSKRTQRIRAQADVPHPEGFGEETTDIDDLIAVLERAKEAGIERVRIQQPNGITRPACPGRSNNYYTYEPITEPVEFWEILEL